MTGTDSELPYVAAETPVVAMLIVRFAANEPPPVRPVPALIVVADKAASVIPYPESVVGVPVIELNAGVIVELDADVMRPVASTATTADCVADP